MRTTASGFGRYAGAMDTASADEKHLHAGVAGIRLTCAGAALTLAWAVGAAAAPVALVTDVVGSSSLRGKPLQLLAEIERDSEIAVAEGARVVVFYIADGTEWTLSGRGRFRLARPAPVAQGNSPAAQAKPQPAPVALAAVKVRTDRAVQGGLQMRGGGERPALVAPVDDVLLDTNVDFAWDPAGAATVYRFELVDAAGGKVFVTDTKESALRLPADVALEPGRSYLWAVSGRDPDTPQPFFRAAEFRIADASTIARLQAARPPDDAPFADRALYVAMLEYIGAKGAARALRKTLAGERSAAWAPPR